MYQELTNLPSPSSITYFWNFGSLLGACLMTQIISGLFLAFHYNSSISDAFSSVVAICQDVNYGWAVRSAHANGASAFFICLFFHVGRGLYYSSFFFKKVWFVGILIFFFVMGISFLGYVLPWGQMSFWGATVITSLISALPYVGDFLVQWVWGGFSVSAPTLTRFFAIHFVLPFVVVALVLIHLLFLHEKGSSNPLGLDLNSDKSFFHPYFWTKDFLGLTFFFFFFFTVVLLSPDLFMDPDNFSLANPLVTPPHIQPEWYFLFAYAILRSIPNKLGGVVGLVLSILILGVLPFLSKIFNLGIRFMLAKKFAFWIFVLMFFMLSWLGAEPVEHPFLIVSQVSAIVYFLTLLILSL